MREKIKVPDAYWKIEFEFNQEQKKFIKEIMKIQGLTPKEFIDYYNNTYKDEVFSKFEGESRKSQVIFYIYRKTKEIAEKYQATVKLQEIRKKIIEPIKCPNCGYDLKVEREE